MPWVNQSAALFQNMHHSISKWISFQINRPTQSIPGNTLRKICSLFCFIEDLEAIRSLSFLNLQQLIYVNAAEFLIIWLIVLHFCFMIDWIFYIMVLSSCTIGSGLSTTLKSLQKASFSFQAIADSLLASHALPLTQPSPHATSRAPSPASSCKPRTDWSIPLEGDSLQLGQHRHGRWRGKILSQTSLTIRP